MVPAIEVQLLRNFHGQFFFEELVFDTVVLSVFLLVGKSIAKFQVTSENIFYTVEDFEVDVDEGVF